MKILGVVDSVEEYETNTFSTMIDASDGSKYGPIYEVHVPVVLEEDDDVEMEIVEGEEPNGMVYDDLFANGVPVHVKIKKI